jgi:catechol 2,3-dioxygenase-like lactoylglutathione lyase family enzyme
MNSRPRVTQIAFSVPDIGKQIQFYQDVLGFHLTKNQRVEHELARKLLGMPDASLQLAWMIGRQDFLQLEFFSFNKPLPRPRPEKWRPCDIGYTRLGVVVSEFDATLQRAARFGALPLAPGATRAGGRRVCIADPAGNIIELMEGVATIPGGLPVARWPYDPAIKYASLSVPDIERSRLFFVDTIGLEEEDETLLHVPEDEQLWGLPSCERDILLCRSGDVFLEIAHYRYPVGNPRPVGYRLSDLGILNVAAGWLDLPPFLAAFERARKAGYASAVEAHELPGGSAPLADTQDRATTYLIDDQGFSFEMFAMPAKYHVATGFAPG